jgi:DNA-binding NarL/FixJ family response regulator
MSGRITVLVVDDQLVVREGLALVLGLLPGIEVVGSAGDGAEAVELAKRLRPHVVLMDLRMPRVDGVEATRRLREQVPETRVVVLTTYSDERTVFDALPDGLTPRETEVLTLIAGGLSNSEIARRLVISEGTVKTHVNRVLFKTGARDRAQAVGYAYQRGLVGSAG